MSWLGRCNPTSWAIWMLGSHAPRCPLHRPFRSRQAAHCALAGTASCRIRLAFCTSGILPTNPTVVHPTTRQPNPESWLQSHLLGPSLQNAPHHDSFPFLPFFDTHFPPSSKHCLHFFCFSPTSLFAKTLHHLLTRPHLRVGQEAEDASQEASQGREDPSRPAGQQPEERHRE